jgi:hypothetical protein
MIGDNMSALREIFSINTDWNNYSIGIYVGYGKISRIEQTEVCGQMAMVTAFEIWVKDENTKEEKLWKLCVCSNYEVEYNIKDEQLEGEI